MFVAVFRPYSSFMEPFVVGFYDNENVLDKDLKKKGFNSLVWFGDKYRYLGEEGFCFYVNLEKMKKNELKFGVALSGFYLSDDDEEAEKHTKKVMENYFGTDKE